MIKKQDLKKLKQLDRIEYLLGRNKIENNSPSFSPIFYLSGFFVLLIVLLFIFGLLINLSYGEEAFIKFLTSIMIIPKAFIWVLIILFIIHIIEIILYLSKINKLNKEFFEQEVKPKK